MGDRKPTKKSDIPAVSDIKNAILTELASGRRRSSESVRNSVARFFGLTAAQREYRISGSKTSLFENRFDKAKAELSKEGLVEYPEHGKIKLVEGVRRTPPPKSDAFQVEPKGAASDESVQPVRHQEGGSDREAAAQTSAQGESGDRANSEGAEADSQTEGFAPREGSGVERAAAGADGALYEVPKSSSAGADCGRSQNASRSTANLDAKEPAPESMKDRGDARRYAPIVLAVLGLVLCLGGQGLLGALFGAVGIVLKQVWGPGRGSSSRDVAAPRSTLAMGAIAVALGLIVALSGACSAGQPETETVQDYPAPSEQVQVEKGVLSLLVTSDGWTKADGAVIVLAEGTSDDGTKVSQKFEVRPGSKLAVPFGAGRYTFTVDPASLEKNDVIYRADSPSCSFDGKADKTIAITLSEDEKAMEERRAALEAAEQAKAQAEADRKAQEEAEAAAAAEAAAVAAAESQKSTQSRTVYITNTGEKYHRDGCSSLRKSKIAISIEDAVAQGYDPCKNCKPGRP